MTRWTTGQVSKLRNISVRTLRYYDQIGLLTPSLRQDNGRRYYSEEDLFILEKIMLLKSLSLSLEDIQKVLGQLSLRDILIAHHHHLQEELASLQASIANTASLINMLDLEGTLPWERVSALVQNAQVGTKKWVDYFAEEEREFLRKALPALESGDRATQQYISLLRRIEHCVKHAIAPESEEAYALACELIKLSDETFGGDAELMDRFWEVRKRPAEETGLYPVSPEVLDFVEQSISFALKKSEDH